jgi:hypothetical protein
MDSLFGENRVNVVFDKATLKQTKDGIKLAKMRFALRLEASILIKAPPEIRAGFEAVETHENGITKVELGEKELRGVNLEFYSMPDSRAISMALQSVDLTDLTIEREQEKGLSTSHLYFTVEVQIGEKKQLRYWIVDNCFNQLWANVEAAQRILLPTVSERGKEERIN